MILNCFDHALLINADEHPARYMAAQDSLKQVGIVAERLAAVMPNNKGHYSSVGKRGCVESHYKAVISARDAGYKNILILEDDVVFRDGFLNYWDSIYPQLQLIDYDIFYFYQWQQAGRTADNLRIIPIAHTLCTHAYAVSSKFYQRYLDVFDHETTIGADSAADRRFTSANARLYAPTFNLIGQSANISSITGIEKPIRYQHRFEDGSR